MLATAWFIVFIAFAAPIAARADAPAVLTRETSLYAQPRTSSTLMAKLDKGELTVLRATSGAWSKVLYRGKTGYLARKAIRRQTAKRLYAARDVSLLDAASASGGTLSEIRAGDVVYAVSSKGDWYKALYKGHTGFVPRSALGSKKPSPTPKTTPTPNPTAAPTPAPAEAYAAKQLKLYKGASTSSQIGTVPEGAEVVRYYYNNKSWAKVVYKGKKGYVAAQYLSAEPPAPTPSPTPIPTPTPTVKPTATPTPAPTAAFALKQLKLYKSASTSSPVCTVPKGAAVVRYYYNNKSWAKVIYNGRKGYVGAQYLSAEPPTATPTPTPVPTSTPKPTPTPTPTPKPTLTPTPTPKPTPTPDSDGYEQLNPEDTGDAVKKLQTRLKALGWFTGSIGGNYLTRTTQAVKDFQSAAGLEPSGTATVEAALMDTPFVMVYRVAPLTWTLGRRLVKLPHYGMVNLIAGRPIVPELVQRAFTAENVIAELQRVLTDGAARDAMLAGLAEVRRKLSWAGTQGSAADRAAGVIVGSLT
jgi:uncharacterized protein YgiM (DUF1202 family)